MTTDLKSTVLPGLANAFDSIEKKATEFLEKIEARAETIIAGVEAAKPSELLIKSNAGEVLVTGVQHSYFKLITKLVSIPTINLALTGECGSGKSRVVMEAAKALSMKWKLQSFNIMSTKSDIAGYLDANGIYRKSAFVQCFENGEVFIADEFDCCSAAVATYLNGAIANKVITLPTGEVLEAHENFRFVAIMNTVGYGADYRYVGREQLDAATLDRFVMLEVPYDWDMAQALLGGKKTNNYEAIEEGGVITSIENITSLVRAAERIFKANKFVQVISPRALFSSHALASHGVGLSWIIKTCIIKGLNEQQKQLVLKDLKTYVDQAIQELKKPSKNDKYKQKLIETYSKASGVVEVSVSI